MLDLPENELFSAYIDGELTSDEQAEVERILASNPDAQQLVDELRSLSHSLQSLPAYKLDEDLAARVLRQAEREMLAQPAAPLPKFHHVDIPEPKPPSWARRILRPRNFAWSAVAIVVAVILMLNEPNTNKGPSNNVAQVPDRVTIEPLDNVAPTVEAYEEPPTAAIARTPEPDETKVEPQPSVPDVVAPAPKPNMVAQTAPETAPPPKEQPVAPAGEAKPLLVLQCQLAEGRVGHEALAELLKRAGIPTGEAISADAEGPLEITLTTDQVCQVVSQLQANTKDFKGYAFLTTPKTAPPRISSAVVPGKSQPEEMTAEGTDKKKPGKATIRFQGTITVQPKAAPGAGSAETTSADGKTSKTTVRAKASPARILKSLPVKDSSAYRVRFVFKPADKPTKSDTPADK